MDAREQVLTPTPPVHRPHPAEAARPALRGWLHACAAVLAPPAFAALASLARPGLERAGVIVFGASAVLLLTTSALLHRGRWSPRWHGVLRRTDHSGIYLAIAGTSTPFALLLLPPGQARRMLLVVWTGAALGTLFRVLWLGAPRPLYVLLYLALGWVTAVHLAPTLRHGGAVVALLAAGGLAHTVGALVYGLRRPDPWPRWFGFHEVFHALTLAGFGAHYVAVLLALGSRAAVVAS